MLCINIQKALYGILKRALLFYKKLRGDIESMGFEINQCNTCVAKKMINGHQMTIICHINGLKLSHKDGGEITKIMKWLGKFMETLKQKEVSNIITLEWT